MRKRYVLSYDLEEPKQRYKELYEKMNSWGAIRLQKSQWLVYFQGMTAEKIKNYLLSSKLIDIDDRLLVICLDDSDWACFNPITYFD